ncbi:MAG TPA: hypothetical protein VF472_19485 [Burkholderiaceae bacterium]
MPGARGTGPPCAGHPDRAAEASLPAQAALGACGFFGDPAPLNAARWPTAWPA